MVRDHSDHEIWTLYMWSLPLDWCSPAFSGRYKKIKKVTNWSALVAEISLEQHHLWPFGLLHVASMQWKEWSPISGRIRLDVTGLLKISHAHLRSSITVTYRSALSRLRIRESSLDTRLTVWRTLVENIRLATFSWDKHVCHKIIHTWHILRCNTCLE